jgi:hypothetical protein
MEGGEGGGRKKKRVDDARVLHCEKNDQGKNPGPQQFTCTLTSVSRCMIDPQQGVVGLFGGF